MKALTNVNVINFILVVILSNVKCYVLDLELFSPVAYQTLEAWDMFGTLLDLPF